VHGETMKYHYSYLKHFVIWLLNNFFQQNSSVNLS